MAHDAPTNAAEDHGDGPPKSDFADHQATFEAFIDVTKIASLIVIVILIGMLIFLV